MQRKRKYEAFLYHPEQTVLIPGVTLSTVMHIYLYLHTHTHTHTGFPSGSVITGMHTCLCLHTHTHAHARVLLWWLCDKEPACQGRRCRFNPWVRKIPWRRKWQLTPVFLPGKSHGHRGMVGYSPWSCKRVRHDSATKQ